MSAFSDFLTQGAAPWWGSGLIGIGGTLLGIAANSVISNKRDQKHADRDETVRDQQNRLEDRRRWETEVRDLVEQSSEAAVAMHANTLPVPSDPTSGCNDPAIWQENYAILKK